jgi:hypothetical protein
MLKVRCLKLGLATLAAGMFFALTQPAQATFTFTIKNVTNGGNATIKTVSSPTLQSLNLGPSGFTYVTGGLTYVFNLTAKTNSASLTPGSTSAVARVSISGTVTVTGGPKGNGNTFNISATDTAFRAPGSPGQPATLWADQDVFSIAKGFSIKTKGQYQDGPPNQTVTTATLQDRFQNGPQNQMTPKVGFTRGTSKFNLGSLDFDINYGSALNGGQGAGPATIDFYSDAVVAMPEPGALVIALIGIPFVLFVVYRRLPRRATVAA